MIGNHVVIPMSPPPPPKWKPTEEHVREPQLGVDWERERERNSSSFIDHELYYLTIESQQPFGFVFTLFPQFLASLDRDNNSRDED